MLITDKKAFIKGLIMSVLFLAVLAYMFSPSFDGENAFRASDKLFNSIAKGSTYYIPGLKDELKPFMGSLIDISIDMPSRELANNSHKLLSSSGAQVIQADNQLKVKGDLGQILLASIEDSDHMFYNRGQNIVDKYAIKEKPALYTWWEANKNMEKALKSQKKFKEAAFVERIRARGIEVGYNFFAIEPESVSTKAGILIFALIFYVAYTLWWGYAIYFLSQGFGLQLKAGKKKEV
jgi:hypothetical protein